VAGPTLLHAPTAEATSAVVNNVKIRPVAIGDSYSAFTDYDNFSAENAIHPQMVQKL
jgi:hypothetical protein